MRKLWIGLVIGGLLVPLIGLLVAVSGVIDMGADSGTGLMGDVGHLMQTRWMTSHASDSTNPLNGDAQAERDGMHMYESMCVHCHGAPDVDPAHWTEGMEPRPPRLWGQRMQSLSDAEIREVIEHGVKLTGMPAFEEHMDPHRAWKLVAFIRSMDSLSPAQKQELRVAAAGHSERRASAR